MCWGCRDFWELRDTDKPKRIRNHKATSTVTTSWTYAFQLQPLFTSVFPVDLRTNYIQFVLAFFKHGDAEIKKQVLGVKGLVSGVFVGMDEDAYPLIEETLSVMYEKLILDTNVPRSLKAFFFSSYILEKLAKIYTRSDPEETVPGETGIPADLVHHFLISICSVPDVGVCFKDTTWYPAKPSTSDEANKNSKITNRVLAKFVTTLKPADDMRQQELVLKILGACPELVQE